MIARFVGRAAPVAGLGRAVAAASATAAVGGGAVAFSLATPSENPLLAHTTFPRYADVKPEHVASALTERLEEATSQLENFEARVKATLDAGQIPAYRFLADEGEVIGELVSGPWSIVSHLKSVKDSKEMREAVDSNQSKVTAFYTRFGQSQALYDGWCALRDDKPSWRALTEAERRVAELEISGAELQGIGLRGANKERFNALEQELAKLRNTFNNNVLDATKSFAHRMTDKAQVSGVPPSALAMMAATARRNGDAGATAEEGPWVATLDGPCLLGVLRHADDPTLREKIYRAYISRASEHGDGGDNAPTIESILALRREQAVLLGYGSYAEVSIAKKMATLSGARALLGDLRTRCYGVAKDEHAELEAYAGGDLAHWDMGYYAHKLKKERYSFDEEETRQYLALDAVLGGLFGVCRRLFGVDIAQVEPAAIGAQVWDAQVRVFEVRRDAQPIGYFYLDPFARPTEKRGGAWMNGAVGRSRAMAPPGAACGVRLPIAILCCNQGEPVTDAKTGEVTPSLMTFGQCTTLFHETGHGLQHMLTNVSEGAVSGISGVEWDAVEQPSQFMEYWVLEEATLASMAKHWKTGAPIPPDLVAKIRAAKNFRAASGMLKQVQIATTDLALHELPDTAGPGAAQRAYVEIARDCAVRPPLAEDRFLCAFSHIFAGGYAAGYYSYVWAEVLSADGFAAFEEGGLDKPRVVEGLGRLYADTVLGMGGSKPAAEVFSLFRGRAPSATALLRHNGLLPTAEPEATAVRSKL